MKIVLYSTHCPKCQALEGQLKKHNLNYITIDDVKVMISMGFTSAPMLIVDGKILDFVSAMKWLKDLK